MKHDTYLRDFFKSPVRFADLMNGTVFEGKRVIDGQKICLDDSNVATVFEGMTMDRQRDVIMKSLDSQQLSMMAIENQSYVDENMPLRNLIYDACNYNYQLKYAKTIYPVISMVFYYGEETWNKPKTLKQMFHLDEGIKKYFNDWNGHIFVADELEVSRFHDKETRDFIMLIQKFHQWNGDASVFENMKTTRDVIIALTPIIKDERLLNMLLENEEGEIDVCRAVEKVMSETMNKGIAHGIVQGIEKGRNEGLQQGKKEGIILSIMTLLKTMFKNVSEDIEQELQLCSLDQLQNILVHISNVKNEQDVRKYLH